MIMYIQLEIIKNENSIKIMVYSQDQKHPNLHGIKQIFIVYFSKKFFFSNTPCLINIFGKPGHYNTAPPRHALSSDQSKKRKKIIIKLEEKEEKKNRGAASLLEPIDDP